MVMYVSVLLAMSMVLYVGCHRISQSKFSEESVLCDLEDRIQRECSIEILNVRSRRECFTKCAIGSSCIGASLDQNGSCFHHKECPLIADCTVKVDGHHRYLTKYCAHGTWDESRRACNCVDGFYGETCRQCHADCTDLLEAGYAPHSGANVYLDPEGNGKRPVFVRCGLAPNYPQVMLLTNSGFQNFNKTWTNYVNGFSLEDGSNYWSGLYAWHRMSKIGYNKLVFGITLPSRDSAGLFRYHSGVSLSDETTKFRVTINGSVWNNTRGPVPSGSYFGDCLGPLQNVPFSTWDADNDQSATENCAARAGSGWWYNSSCDNPCNALGFGPQSLDTLPTYQVMSLLGLDMNRVSSEDIVFYMYLTK